MNLPGVESAPVSGSEAPSLIVSGTFAAGAAEPGALEVGAFVEPPQAATVSSAVSATIAIRRIWVNPPTLVRLAAIMDGSPLGIRFPRADRSLARDDFRAASRRRLDRGPLEDLARDEDRSEEHTSEL